MTSHLPAPTPFTSTYASSTTFHHHPQPEGVLENANAPLRMTQVHPHHHHHPLHPLPRQPTTLAHLTPSRSNPTHPPRSYSKIRYLELGRPSTNFDRMISPLINCRIRPNSGLRIRTKIVPQRMGSTGQHRQRVHPPGEMRTRVTHLRRPTPSQRTCFLTDHPLQAWYLAARRRW